MLIRHRNCLEKLVLLFLLSRFYSLDTIIKVFEKANCWLHCVKICIWPKPLTTSMYFRLYHCFLQDRVGAQGFSLFIMILPMQPVIFITSTQHTTRTAPFPWRRPWSKLRYYHIPCQSYQQVNSHLIQSSINYKWDCTSCVR